MIDIIMNNIDQLSGSKIKSYNVTYDNDFIYIRLSYHKSLSYIELNEIDNKLFLLITKNNLSDPESDYPLVNYREYQKIVFNNTDLIYIIKR